MAGRKFQFVLLYRDFWIWVWTTDWGNRVHVALGKNGIYIYARPSNMLYVTMANHWKDWVLTFLLSTSKLISIWDRVSSPQESEISLTYWSYEWLPNVTSALVTWYRNPRPGIGTSFDCLQNVVSGNTDLSEQTYSSRTTIRKSLRTVNAWLVYAHLELQNWPRLRRTGVRW